MEVFRYLFTTKPYAGRECIEWIREYLASLNISLTVERVAGHRVIASLDKLIPDTCMLLRNIRCVSRVVELRKFASPPTWSLDDVAKTCVEVINSSIDLGSGIECLDVRRWDKTKNFTSLELSRRLAKELGVTALARIMCRRSSSS